MRGIRLPSARLPAVRLPAVRPPAFGLAIGGGDYGLNEVIIKPEWNADFSWLAGRRAHAVVGPPGTGKTAALLRLASTGAFECCGRAISLELEPELIYLAFNRSAAEDAEERAGALPIHAATIHAIGARALAAHMGAKVGEVLLNLRRTPGGPICGRFALCGGGGGCLGADESLLVLRRCAAKKYGIKFSSDPFRPALGNRLFGLLDYAVHVAPESGVKQLAAQLPPALAHVILDYQATLKDLGRHDFTTALAEAARLGLPYRIQEGTAALKARVAFIDEAQDLSPLMWYYLPHVLADVREAVFALDFYQTVYDSLHGADMRYGRALLDAIRAHGGTVLYLAQSKRVADRVAETAKAVLPDPDPEYVQWRGRGDVGDVYVVSPTEMVEIAKDYLSRDRPVFALAPTNVDVLWTASLFLRYGLIPRGLKDMPTAVCRRLRAARLAVCRQAGLVRPDADQVQPDEVAAKLAEALVQRFRYVLLEFVPAAYVCHYLNRAVRALRCGPSFPLSGEPPIGVPKPPPLYVDTPYTAKGLEADAVFVVDRLSFDVRPSPLALYVALTRSRGDVYIVDAPGARRWVPPEVYRRAKRP